MPDDRHVSKQGFNRRISRRDFLNSVLVGAGATLAACSPLRRLSPSPTPPLLPGEAERSWGGDDEETYAACHALRDADRLPADLSAEETGEAYDLAIVGAGLGGLSAAFFFRQRQPDARVLLLDGHPEFGGNARRHAVAVKGQTVFAPAGTSYGEAIESRAIHNLYRDLGITYGSLRMPRSEGAWLFDQESNGVPRQWVHGLWYGGHRDAPWPEAVKADFSDYRETLRDFYSQDDWRSELTRLDTMTFKDWIEREQGWDPEVTRVADVDCADSFGLGADAISAGAAFWFFAGGGGETLYTFPGGCSGFARYLVQALIPNALPGEDPITSPLDDDTLDRPGGDVRIRLKATVLRVEHDGPPDSADGVWITFARGDRLYRVKARTVVMAGGGYTTKHIVADLPDEQREAYEQFVYAAYLVANVWVNTSRFIDELDLGWDVSLFDGLAGYVTVADAIRPEGRDPNRDPDRPNALTLWCPRFYRQGTPREQGVRGRKELLHTPFADYEALVRRDLVRVFGPLGFDPDRHVEAIALNRWGHAMVVAYPGFAFGGDESPPQIAKRPFGRIAFAHTDVAGTPYMAATYQESRRAVGQVLRWL